MKVKIDNNDPKMVRIASAIPNALCEGCKKNNKCTFQDGMKTRSERFGLKVLLTHCEHFLRLDNVIVEEPEKPAERPDGNAKTTSQASNVSKGTTANDKAA